MVAANYVCMEGVDQDELRPHDFFIRHQGKEMGPFDISRLRQMWAAGEIDPATKFKRADWSYWGDAEDLLVELEFKPPDEVEAAMESEKVTPPVQAKELPRLEETKAATPAAIPVLSKAAPPLQASGDLSHVAKPYSRPILYWLLVVIAALAVLSGAGVVLTSGSKESVAVFMASIPIFLFAIAAFGFAQLVDYLGRTSHFTEQSAELLHRELPALRKALESRKETR